MTDMVVLAFDSEKGADQGRQKLVELNNEYLLNLVDAVEVVRLADRKVRGAYTRSNPTGKYEAQENKLLGCNFFYIVKHESAARGNTLMSLSWDDSA